MRLFRNIKKWWPILKEDEDWDFYFLLKVMNFKLEKMEEHIGKHGHSEDSKAIAKELDEAGYYLRQLIEDDFFDHDTLDKKWGETKLVFNSDNSVTFTNAKIKTDDDRKQYHKDFAAEVEKEDERKQFALDKFCQIFKTKLFGWWD